MSAFLSRYRTEESKFALVRKSLRFDHRTIGFVFVSLSLSLSLSNLSWFAEMRGLVYIYNALRSAVTRAAPRGLPLGASPTFFSSADSVVPWRPEQNGVEEGEEKHVGQSRATRSGVASPDGSSPATDRN